MRLKGEMQEFVKFFRSKGVGYSMWFKSETPERFVINHKLPKTTKILSVSQSYFYFDENSKYLGVEADEIGCFVPRK